MRSSAVADATVGSDGRLPIQAIAVPDPNETAIDFGFQSGKMRGRLIVLLHGALGTEIHRDKERGH
jgi:hypothetical protein